MSGVEYLLDTNFILGMLKSDPDVLNIVASKQLLASHCGYSAVTRMELLGFPGIKTEEESLIRSRLENFTYYPIDLAVEDLAIQLRRTRKVNLPDALIAATAIFHGLQLLSLDVGLQAVISDNDRISTK
jgi:predicted nucleic acid-binding protein